MELCGVKSRSASMAFEMHSCSTFAQSGCQDMFHLSHRQREILAIKEKDSFGFLFFYEF